MFHAACQPSDFYTSDTRRCDTCQGLSRATGLTIATSFGLPTNRKNRRFVFMYITFIVQEKYKYIRVLTMNNGFLFESGSGKSTTLQFVI